MTDLIARTVSRRGDRLPGWSNGTTVLDDLCRQFEDHPDGVAFTSGVDAWSYRRLVAEVERLVHALRAQGVRPGDRVALHMTNVPELVTAYYACFRIGAIAVPLNIRLKTVELRALLMRLRPTLYLGQAQLYPHVAPIDSEVLEPESRFVVGDGQVDRAQPWKRLFAKASARLIARDADVDPPALLVATSGTTGQPKFVTHTLATLSAFTEVTRRLEMNSDQIAIVASPMVHIAGLVTFLSCVRSGAPVVLFERFDAEAVLDAIAPRHCSWMVGMPFMFAEMAARQRARRRDVESLKFCLSVGDVCPAGLQQVFLELFGVPLHSFWGSTEAGCFLYGLQPGPVSRIPPGVEVRLVDDRGVPVPPGEVGELQVRGPAVTPGYWTSPGRIDDPKSDGWFATGDLMRRGEGDDLWFIARKKELIVRCGSNISPVEVESVLRANAAVCDVAVVGIPDEALGQRVAALVEFAGEAGTAALDEILAEAKTQLADYKVPERLKIVDKIPRNANGKIDRKCVLAIVRDA